VLYEIINKMTYLEFIKKFKPISNEIEGSETASLGGTMFSLDVESMEHVKSYKYNNIWTVVEADDEDSDIEWYIVSGMRFVNTIGYLVTEVSWNTEYTILIPSN